MRIALPGLFPMKPFPISIAIGCCCIGIYLVSTGLLSKRSTFPHKHSCSRRPVESLFEYPNATDETCWLPSLNSKHVVVLIDALRHDFVDGSNSPLYFVRNLIHNNKAYYSVFLSDPPTTTSQRVVGISSGTFPTYLESFLNFKAESLKGSDSFIYQLWQRHPDKCYFYGDNTWTELYPFMTDGGRAKGYHSFNMFDLNYVDQAVYKDLSHFYNSKAKKEFSFLEIHLLGLDHAGHTFNAQHPAITAKLAEYNQVLIELSRQVDESTGFFVFGDHGMTESGDHGGESWDEIATCLIHWSGSWSKVDLERCDRYKEFLESVEIIRRRWSTHSSGVSQVDFCPTLCLVAGIPIPFENIGSIIPEVIMRNAIHKYNDDIWIFRYLLDSIRMQLYSVAIYLETSGKLELRSKLQTKLQELDPKNHSQHDLSIDELQALFLDLFTLSQQLVSEIRISMIEINYDQMKKGLFFIIIGCLTTIFSTRSWKFLSCCVFGIFFSIAYISNSHVISEFSIVSFLLSGFMFCTLLFNQNEMRKMNRILTLFFICLIRFGKNLSQPPAGITATFIQGLLFLMCASIIVVRTNILHPSILIKWSLTLACCLVEIFIPSAKGTIQKVALFASIVMLHSTPSIWLECLITLLQRPITAIYTNNLLIIARILHEENYNVQNYKPIFFPLFAWYLFGVTEHSYQVSAIQWDRAFYAIDGYFPIWNAFLIMLNSFGPFLIPFCLEFNPKYLHFLFTFEFIKLFFCSLCVFIHARHLMSFGIFIPRFILQIFSVLFVSLGFCIRNYVYSCRK